MPILTALGGIFSSWRIYMLIGVAVVAAGLFAYIEYLRADAANAHAALSSAEATINEEKAVIDQDTRAIQALQLARQADEAALRASMVSSTNIGNTLSQIRDQINAIPQPKTCQSLDARDRAAIGGVRRLVAPANSNPGN